MREYVSLDVLANWVTMMRADVRGAIWLPDDNGEARFYEQCSHSHARVVPAAKVATQLLERVRSRGVRGVVAVVRGANEIASAESGVLRPGIGDIASLLLLSAGYERVLRDLCGSAWFTACSQTLGDLRLRAVVAVRRTQSTYERRHGRPNISVPLQEVVDLINWDVLEVQDAGSIGAIATDETEYTSVDDPAFRADLLACDGMQVLEIISLSTANCTPHGIRSERHISTGEFMSALRLAFDLQELESDDLFWQIGRWQRANPMYPLVRQWRALDPLGVVLDQRYWESDLTIALTRIQQGKSIGIAKMDLDNFKGVNEALGHTGGDEAIRHYCRIVKRIASSLGEVYRRGGDEVVIIAPEITRKEFLDACEAVREAIELEFKQWCETHQVPQALTVSMGIVFVDETTSVDQTVARLDVAQLDAKRQGKNRVVVG